MNNKDLLLEDFKNSSQELEDVSSIKGGEVNRTRTLWDASGTQDTHTSGDIGNCDNDPELDYDSDYPGDNSPGGSGNGG